MTDHDIQYPDTLTRIEFRTMWLERTEPDARACIELANVLWDKGEYEKAERQQALALRYDKAGADKRLARLEKQLEEQKAQRGAQAQIQTLRAVDGGQA